MRAGVRACWMGGGGHKGGGSMWPCIAAAASTRLHKHVIKLFQHEFPQRSAGLLFKFIVANRFSPLGNSLAGQAN